MGYISQFEASDIDSDDIDLRFEVDAVETGTTVSIVDECGHAAQIITALLDELEHYKSREERVTKLVLDNSTSWDALYKKLEAAEKRIAELEARAFNPAILDVIAERQRQQSVEGWMPEHDDEHCNGELAMAAVCYINETGTVNRNGGKPWGWPWDASWWKPNARRRNLVKAGALILAEIERIDRAAGIGKGE
ncbi:ead/Ea22-like family protein [Salmonella enterica subsp. enterica]|nr:ead/Ea22-like family protein [Salmonella enterica]ECI3136852.1 ead/Ea22-like family protein [Salmonella enterica subsp. enterica]EDR4764698.1 ead/Ea22-like family protein [Salmonella enterica subsp. enterica serovar Bergen]EBR5193569.1 ead/Ea22-like family protein [Salmonella enterica]ECJ7061506.1 ead/Ea22-like family protein [Salmonella enterica subsp. enterica]